MTISLGATKSNIDYCEEDARSVGFSAANDVGPSIDIGHTHIPEAANDDWLACLSAYGICAALMSYHQPGLVRRQALVRGLDALRSRPAALAEALGRADAIWRAQAGRSCVRQFERPFETLAPFASGAMLAVRHDGANANLCALFFRAPELGPFPPALVAAIGQLMPTLAMSAGAHLAHGRAERRYRMLQAALDRLAMPMILLDRGSRVLHRNDAAEALLGGARGLAVAPDETLVCADRGRTRALRSAVRAVADAPLAAATPRVVRLAGDGQEPTLGYVCPSSGEDMAGCATLIIPPATVRAVPPEALEALGLLPSERRFLAAFLSADGLRDAAAAAGVSEETGRTYLKRIKLKLGVSRQVDLVRLMCSLSPPLEGLLARGAVTTE